MVTMEYKCYYASRLGKIILSANENKLTGLWFENSRYRNKLDRLDLIFNADLEVFEKTKNWLDRYFNGQKPNADEIPIELCGSAFSLQVWELLKDIPYGETVTYGDIAKKIAKQNGVRKMSAQAVGNAVGCNPISIIIPCHRVLGANGNLTGYAGGVDKKIELLKIEKESR